MIEVVRGSRIEEVNTIETVSETTTETVIETASEAVRKKSKRSAVKTIIGKEMLRDLTPAHLHCFQTNPSKTGWRQLGAVEVGLPHEDGDLVRVLRTKSSISTLTTLDLPYDIIKKRKVY